MMIEDLLSILVGVSTLFIVLYLLWVLIPVFSGLPWIPTRRSRICRALEMACITPGEVVVDLGSGDGRVLILAASEFKARAVGIEISPLHCIIARINAILHGVSRLVDIKWASFYKVDLSNVDVVFIYMTSREAMKLQPRLETQLHPGVRVISISCEIGGWYPIAFSRDDLIYMYRIGTHTLVDCQPCFDM